MNRISTAQAEVLSLGLMNSEVLWTLLIQTLYLQIQTLKRQNAVGLVPASCFPRREPWNLGGWVPHARDTDREKTFFPMCRDIVLNLSKMHRPCVSFSYQQWWHLHVLTESSSFWNTGLCVLVFSAPLLCTPCIFTHSLNLWTPVPWLCLIPCSFPFNASVVLIFNIWKGQIWFWLSP